MNNDLISRVAIGLAGLALIWVLWPLTAAVFWAAILAIVFAPVHAAVLARMPRRRNLAALIVVMFILLLVVLPTVLIAVAVIRELVALLAAIQSGTVNLHDMYQSVLQALPLWAQTNLTRLGLSDLSMVVEGLIAPLGTWVGTNAPKVLSIGQSTIWVVVSLGVMLYLSFFLIRDGRFLVRELKRVVPLGPEVCEEMLSKFTQAVRATVQGDILVAILQGALGGAALWLLGIHGWLLWMVLMMLLSLLPVFGAALIWGPVAVWLMATGLVWQGVALVVYGTLVIGLIDNITRPLLVGQAAKMPEYVVLLTTIGGIASFGAEGFIIGPVVGAMFIAVWTTFIRDRVTPDR